MRTDKHRDTTGGCAPAAEALEPRLLLSTFLVTNINDSGPGSLRSAIEMANSRPGLDVISFDIPDPGRPRTIEPLTPLPAITDPLTLDGYTQPGSSENLLLPQLGQNNAKVLIGISAQRLQSPATVRFGLTSSRWWTAVS